jgi:Zn-dependent M28 family amino/carboxypeptidase
MVTKVAGRPWEEGALQHPPELVMAVEHYNRIMRILEKDIPVTLDVEIAVSVIDDDPLDYNLIADIPGTDLADEVVMLGAHLDAHGAATGAEDNATGAAQVMEAARILTAIGVEPRRTIRFVLWGGEELGHLGSRAYVQKHFVDAQTGEYSREQEQFSCYFNLDYGTGRIRGVYLMNNFDAKPILNEWMKPLLDLDFTHLVLVAGQDIGSDHEQFEAVGLPVFPFLQDPVENDSRSFHSNMDVYDRIVSEYLIQGAIVAASLAYHAAMRDEKMPRVLKR